MARKRFPKKDGGHWRGRSVVVAYALIACVLVSTAMLAERPGTPAAPPEAASEDQESITLASLDPASPAKEHVYAGARLLATEQPCGGYAISPVSRAHPSTGGEWQVNVSAPAGCSWSAVSNDSWVEVTSTDIGIVNYVVRDNFDERERTGSMRIAGLTFTVRQAGTGTAFGNCASAISPPSQSFPVTGGTGTINVFAYEDCLWTASSSVSWVTITSEDNGFGSGTLTYSVAANNTGAVRVAGMNVGGLTFRVKQKGS
jgi:hypothetical protein